MQTNKRRTARVRRHNRVRKLVAGSPDRPRLAVFRSSRQIYAQLIDDVAAATLVSAGSLDSEIRTKPGEGGKVRKAREVGELLASRARDAGICKVVFDRGGYKYHGRVAALADGAREGGLEF